MNDGRVKSLHFWFMHIWILLNVSTKQNGPLHESDNCRCSKIIQNVHFNRDTLYILSELKIVGVVYKLLVTVSNIKLGKVIISVYCS